MPISRETFIHEATGATFESTWVGDRDGPAKPGLLLFPNFFGLKDWDVNKSEALASLGYTVLAVDYYGQGKRGTDMESSGALMAELNDDRAMMRDRLLTFVETLKGLPAVDPARLGAIGFCFGGKCVLDLARAGGEIRAGVLFHGVYDAPPFPKAPITARLLVCHGWNDPLCPPEATVALARELTEAGVDWQIHAYGHTGHAFTADNMPIDDARTFGFQPQANDRSWAAMKDFLAASL